MIAALVGILIAAAAVVVALLRVLDVPGCFEARPLHDGGDRCPGCGHGPCGFFRVKNRVLNREKFEGDGC